MKRKQLEDRMGTLEERINRAGEIFGVEPEILTSRADQQVILTCLERIGVAANKVLDSSVAGELALAGIDLQAESLPPVLDYAFAVRKYSELIDFAASIPDDGVTVSFAKKLISEKIGEEQKSLTESEQKYTRAVENAQTTGIQKALNVALFKVQEYSGLLEEHLSEWDTAAEETDPKAEEAGASVRGPQRYSGLGANRGRGETVASRVEPRAVGRSEDSDPITYFSIRGKRFYSAPKAAQLLGIDYSQLGYNNNLSLETLTDLEAAGKVKLVKREKGQATKVYREDALVELLSEKIRDRIDLAERLKETDQQEYSGTFKILKLADSGFTDHLPAAGGRREDQPTSKVPQKRKYQRKIPPSGADQAEKPLRRKEGTPLPEELIPIFNAQGLEQTIAGAEDLFFLAVNGARLFPALEIRKAYEGRTYGDRSSIPSSSYSAYIVLNQDKFPEGSLLTVRVMVTPKGKISGRETYFVREDQVQLAIPKYVPDQFTDLISNYSLRAYSLGSLDGGSLAAEVQKYGLDKDLVSSKRPANGRRKTRATEPAVSGAQGGLEAAVGTAALLDVTAPDQLISYEDLPSQLGGQYDMGTVDTACQILAGDSKITLSPMIPDLGDDSPKGLKHKDLGILRDYLAANA